MAREMWSRNWDRMTFDEQREYRDRKFAYFVRTQLYPYSPFYRRLFDANGIDPHKVRGVDSLRALPFTYKSDIAPDTGSPERFRDLVLQPDEDLMRKHLPRTELARLQMARVLRGRKYVSRQLWDKYWPVHIQFTTGRTGRPTPILYARDDVARMAEAGRRVLELAGFGTVIERADSNIVNAMPFAPHLAFWMVSKGLDRSGLLALHTGGGRVLGTNRIINAVEYMRAAALIGMPSYVYRVLREAAAMGRDFSSLKLVLISGERVPAGMKEKLAGFLERMGACDFDILGALGFTEGRKAYSECAPDGESGYHVFPDMDYFEIVDPASGEPVAEGEDGELVYTCLEGQGTSVVRFRTGDFVRGGIVYEPCPTCGRRVPRLSSDISRSGGAKGFSLIKLKGALVDQGAFFDVLLRNPEVEDWQVEIDKAGGDPYEVDEVNVFIAARPGVDERELEREIANQLQIETEVKPNTIRFLPLAELVERLRVEGGMKELRFVDKRPQI